MKFAEIFRVQSVRVLPPREGKRAQLQVEVATFGHTFRIYVDESLKPKFEVGKEVQIEFGLRAGAYGKPEAYVSDVG